MTIGLDLEVVRSSGDVVTLDTGMLTETDIYLASADIETTRTHKLEALRRLTKVIASSEIPEFSDDIELPPASQRSPGLETAAAFFVRRKRIRQDLDRDITPNALIAGSVIDTHPARAEDRGDLVGTHLASC